MALGREGPPPLAVPAAVATLRVVATPRAAAAAMLPVAVAAMAAAAVAAMPLVAEAMVEAAVGPPCHASCVHHALCTSDQDFVFICDRVTSAYDDLADVRITK